MKKLFTVKRIITIIISIILLACISVNIIGCTEVKAENLMNGVTPNKPDGKPADDRFTEAYMNFAVELFKKTNNENENTLISPLSVLLGLSMTANGAGGETKAQMEKVLYDNLTVDEMNEYLISYVNSLPSKNGSKLKIANSIWFRDDEQRLKVEKDFLQKNADYYNSSIYKAPFDKNTLSDINTWVESETDGLIKGMLGKIDKQAEMYLINALAFDAEWKDKYLSENNSDEVFTCIDGSERVVEMMQSENEVYITTPSAEGFIKPYKNNSYSFVAILPNETIDINNYIESFSGAELSGAIKNTEICPLKTYLPKFQGSCLTNLKDALKNLGITDAFDDSVSDFSRIGTSAVGRLFVNDVIHKTYIEVNEDGTKAAAAAEVDVHARSDCSVIKLNRPFVYVIIDNSTNLPVFIGTVKKF